MEVAAGNVFRQFPCFSDASNCRHLPAFLTVKQSRSLCTKQPPNRKSLAVLAGSGEFSDQSHFQYYNGARMAIKEKETEIPSKKKEMKKKLKLLKGLSKNLSTFSDMGFGLNPVNGLDYQVKGQMISEATEVLLEQLQKLKAEKMESKMKKKEEKARKKAARMMTESSSSESSSESECENVVKTSQLKATPTSTNHEEATSMAFAPIVPLEVENRGAINVRNVGVSVDEKKIEVCMGGKCKKSGAAMLMENFQKAVGGEAAVVGCKCMGKCRDGPNVKVCSSSNEVSPPPLCIGVGLEDVDLIVSNFFGRNVAAGALSSA